jgi:uncharacterized protein YabE (DUF348 family)
MEVIRRFGKKIAAGSAAVGAVLTILSFLASPQPISADIWLDGAETPVRISVDNLIAANWLMEAGIRIYPGDSVRYGGIAIPYDFKLPDEDGQYLLYKPAVPITINAKGERIHFYSGAETLGEALWEQGIRLRASDDLSLPMNTPLDEAMSVTLQWSQPIQIQSNNETIEAQVSSLTVGAALAEAGAALQFLDYSIPAAEEPIPEDGIIRVVRVREEVLTETTIIPFAEERISDPQMNIGEEQVLQQGENGLQSKTVRLRFEDGEEVSREVVSEWVSKAPIAQRIAYGGNVIVQTYASSDGAVDYWLAMDVYITSYLDTGNPTATGIWPYYGVIAVSPEWFTILKGSSIYVPGYGVGTVLDVCPGCAGKAWIDVFIPTDQYVSWSRNETVYFLPPVPDGFTGELP